MAARKDHRAALLEGAIECLQKKGYARTTARDIVAAAGSHLPSINYYFGSKEALLNEAIAECTRRWLSQLALTTAGTTAADPWEWLRAVSANLFEVYEENRPIVVAFVEALAQAERSPALRTQLAELTEELRVGVAGLVRDVLPEEPGADGRTARAIASLLMAAADGLMLQWLLDPERTPPSAEILQALESAVAGAQPTEPAA